MKRYRLSPATEADLDDIWNYTAANWSTEQAEKYVASLFDAFVAIGENPSLGQRMEGGFPSYRRFHRGHHFIFYVQAADNKVDVIRILHEKSDALRHLDDQK
jgi:toxin ParE1/3/4